MKIVQLKIKKVLISGPFFYSSAGEIVVSEHITPSIFKSAKASSPPISINFCEVPLKCTVLIEESMKESVLILSRVSGSVISVRSGQSANTYSPMLVIVFGIITVVKFWHPRHTLSGIAVIVSENTTFFI